VLVHVGKIAGMKGVPVIHSRRRPIEVAAKLKRSDRAR